MEPLKSGYMTKCGKSVKSWKKRWFVLKPNGFLYYYTDPSCKTEKGNIDIVNSEEIGLYNSISTAEKLSDPGQIHRSFGIALSERTYTCVCDSEEECRSWLESLSKVKDPDNPQQYPPPTYQKNEEKPLTGPPPGHPGPPVTHPGPPMPQPAVPPPYSGPVPQSRPPMAGPPMPGPPMPPYSAPMPQSGPPRGFPQTGSFSYPSQGPPPRGPMMPQPAPYYPPQPQRNSYAGPPPPQYNRNSGYYQNPQVGARPPPAPYQSRPYVAQPRPPPPRPAPCPVIQQRSSVNVTVVNLAQPQQRIVYR